MSLGASPGKTVRGPRPASQEICRQSWSHASRVGRGGGTGVVAVLHDLSLAALFCDRFVVLSEGRIAAADRPDAARDDRLLAEVFGVGAARGRHADGTPYILPWSRLSPGRGEQHP